MPEGYLWLRGMRYTDDYYRILAFGYGTIHIENVICKSFKYNFSLDEQGLIIIGENEH